MSEERSQIDREGIFRALPIAFGIKEGQTPSQSVGVSIKVLILEKLEGEEWVDWRSYGVEAEGDFYIIKKDGSVSEDMYRRLIRTLEWDGDLRGLAAEREWPGVQITIKNDPYNGNDRFRVQWINGWDYKPQAGFQSDPESIQRVLTRHGAKLRAISGNMQRVAPAASSESSKPPMPKPAPLPPPMATTVKAAKEDLPF